MANESLSTGLARPSIEPWIVDGAFPRCSCPSSASALRIAQPGDRSGDGTVHGDGGGDAVRQVLYLVLVLCIGGFALFRRGLDVVRAVPPMLIVLLAWCLLSASWAAAPDVAVRRAALAIVVVVSTMLCVDVVGGERAFRIWWLVLAGVLIVNWLSIGFVHQAMHLPGEQDPGLWRLARALLPQEHRRCCVGGFCAGLLLHSASNEALDRHRALRRRGRFHGDDALEILAWAAGRGVLFRDHLPIRLAARH